MKKEFTGLPVPSESLQNFCNREFCPEQVSLMMPEASSGLPHEAAPVPASAPAGLCPGGRQPLRGLGSPCTASRGAAAAARVLFSLPSFKFCLHAGSELGLAVVRETLPWRLLSVHAPVSGCPGAGVSPRCTWALPCEPPPRLHSLGLAPLGLRPGATLSFSSCF